MLGALPDLDCLQGVDLPPREPLKELHAPPERPGIFMVDPNY
jgi:hypothetical protein